MEVNATSLIYLFGAAQALLLIIGINYRQPLVSTTKLVTSILLIVMLFLMLYYAILLNGFHAFSPYIHSLGSAAWMAITPAYYLMLKSIREPKWKLQWKHLLYFIFSLILLAEFALTSLGIPAWLFLLANDSGLYLDVWMLCFFLPGFYFVGKTIHQQHQPEQLTKNKSLRWFSYVLMLVLIVFAVIYLLVRKDYVNWFELTLIVFCELFVFMLVFKTFKSMSLRQFFDSTKYDNQEISKTEFQQLAQQLEYQMTHEKIYQNKDLKLSELAHKSGISTNDLSQLFSLHYQSNFYDFVNQYRLNHLEKMLFDDSNRQYKILALAEESGFKSKTTFYKVFKEKHQLTPAQFMKKNQIPH